jgi:hypothetical protein
LWSMGEIGLSLGDLAIPFKLSGTLAKPSRALDKTQTAMAVGKSLGETALPGPAGLVAPLLKGGSGDGAICPAAVEAASRGVKLADVVKSRESKENLGKAAEGATGAVRGVGSKLKKLVGS